MRQHVFEKLFDNTIIVNWHCLHFYTPCAIILLLIHVKMFSSLSLCSTIGRPQARANVLRTFRRVITEIFWSLYRGAKNSFPRHRHTHIEWLSGAWPTGLVKAFLFNCFSGSCVPKILRALCDLILLLLLASFRSC